MKTGENNMKTVSKEDATKAADNVLKLIALSHDRIELLHKLEKALRVAALCPEAFKEGAIQTRVYEGIDNCYPLVGFNRPKIENMTFIVTTGSGKEFTYPLADVPRVLWRDDIREAYERHERLLARRKAR